MGYAEYVIYILRSLEQFKDNLDAIYLYDHANPDTITIGDEELHPLQAGDHPEFWEGIREYTWAGTMLHFRGCKIAQADTNGQRPLLDKLALLTDRVVTACEGTIRYIEWSWLFEPRGPDYRFEGDVWWAWYDYEMGDAVEGIYWKLNFVPITDFIDIGTGLPGHPDVRLVPDYRNQPY